MVDIKILLVFLSTTFALITDRTIRRLNFNLTDNIISFVGGGAINFKIEFIDSNSNTSTIEIETEQWILDQGLEISQPPNLHIYSTNDNIHFPKINVYLRLHTRPSSIILRGTAKLTTINSLIIDTFSLILYDSSIAHITVEINSILYVNVSDSSQLFIRGFVKGTAYFDISGQGQANAYVTVAQKIDVNTFESRRVYYDGKLESKVDNNSILKKSLLNSPFSNTTSKQLNTSIILCFIVVVFLF
ncbi:hypothetical protein I4U23_026197 [Adineta vaga]|nr:hypothetical protein I4U23_026197 [Adineta vaga]